MKQHTLSRRDFLISASMTGATVALAACAIPSQAPAATGDDNAPAAPQQS